MNIAASRSTQRNRNSFAFYSKYITGKNQSFSENPATWTSRSPQSFENLYFSKKMTIIKYQGSKSGDPISVYRCRIPEFPASIKHE